MATAEGAGGAEDPEAEKRRKRAERFGIPYVEPKVKAVPAAGAKGAKGKGAKGEKSVEAVKPVVDQAVLDAEVCSTLCWFEEEGY